MANQQYQIFVKDAAYILSNPGFFAYAANEIQHSKR
jgi:hypothetical protein